MTVERKGAILKMVDVKAVKAELAENNNYSSILTHLQGSKVGEVVKVITTGDYLTGEYTVREFEKLDSEHVKVLGMCVNS